MIYLDSSVVLSQLFAEDRSLPEALRERPLISSRLLEYEVWNRVHARGLMESHGAGAREWLGRVLFIELNRVVLGRALEPFPVSVRTLDALHLASIQFLRESGLQVELASFDNRLLSCARALEVAIYPL